MLALLLTNPLAQVFAILFAVGFVAAVLLTAHTRKENKRYEEMALQRALHRLVRTHRVR